ncbi:histidine ammonia-lyase [Flammeovirga sp. SJP92]|uniref:HAL/PAL/TAL family ammonia-lyase n=1 Tax=Flammeovirga sp. SJP92 TaxID=1775430 RepID=UPI0007899251|nr:aromatic amino acid ammonia-lyase [Flammeovirga sp. SJP92]KXX71701.1 histidine ammonia-lyase [Flammeovirga sp. SJP92]
MLSIEGNISKLDFFEDILLRNEQIILNPSAKKKIIENYNFLQEFSSDKIIYGINTGFGPMAQYKVNESDQIQLQYNLIRSHASGGGKKITLLHAKSLLLCRLNTFLQAKSGVHIELIHLMIELLNRNIIPVIYEHGGVGASGDLVQLAHLALALIGEGEVEYNGEVCDAKEVFEKEQLKPLQIHLREGLALLNGTSCMTGIGAVNLLQAYKLLDWVVIGSATINEVVSSFDDYFSEELNAAKTHPGQHDIAGMIRTLVEDSQLIRKRENVLYQDEAQSIAVFQDKVQEYYSIRCVPQILGPILETLREVEKVVLNEANSVSDNPIICSKTENVYHGGNFHGDYVSLAMDKLKIVMTKLSMLMDRQLNYLFNHKLNNILPPFINHGTLGLNFGMQGAQFPVTSTVAENQSISFPNYVHSIPNNNDNQDIVSMGTNSALLTKKVIENSFEVVATYQLSIAQAVSYLKIQDKMDPKLNAVYELICSVVPPFKEDYPIFKDLRKLKEVLSAENTTQFFKQVAKEI